MTAAINGEDFNAETPAQVVSSSVDTFPPRRGTVYVLTNEMTLKSAKGNTLEIYPGKKFVVKG